MNGASKEVTLIVMEYLTVEEVAQELKYSVETVKRMLRKNQMPGYKLGGEWRIDATEYREWKEQRKNAYQKPDQES